MKTTLIACALSLGLVSTAMADAHKDKMPGPPAELGELGMMVGTWKCTGSSEFNGQKMPATRSTMKAKWSLGKHWIATEYKQSKSKGVKHAYAASEHIGYANGEYVRLGVDNMGGQTQLKSSGWKDGKMEWTGTAQMMGQSMDMKETVTKVGKRKVSVQGSMSTGGKMLGSWTADCKR